MNCPTGCDTQLLMTERQGVEIDYCPTCRGVWLDRGELDKILDRAAAELASPAAPPVTDPGPGHAPPYEAPRVTGRDVGTWGSPEPYRDRSGGYPPPGSPGGPKRKKSSFLSELLDFG